MKDFLTCNEQNDGYCGCRTWDIEKRMSFLGSVLFLKEIAPFGESGVCT